MTGSVLGLKDRRNEPLSRFAGVPLPCSSRPNPDLNSAVFSTGVKPNLPRTDPGNQARDSDNPRDCLPK
jgi:hypothetical protein